MRYLEIAAERTAYSVGDIRRTMTVGELQAALDSFDEDMPVYLSHDNGYTFGGITWGVLEEVDTEEE